VIKLTVISPKKMTAILRQLGFTLDRQRGSHAYYRHEDGRSVVIPMHAGEDLRIGLLREILKSSGLTVEEYDKLRRNV